MIFAGGVGVSGSEGSVDRFGCDETGGEEVSGLDGSVEEAVDGSSGRVVCDSVCDSSDEFSEDVVDALEEADWVVKLSVS